jgi:hypothetical protein
MKDKKKQHFKIMIILGMISTEELGVMSITQQLLYICYQVKIRITNLIYVFFSYV